MPPPCQSPDHDKESAMTLSRTVALAALSALSLAAAQPAAGPPTLLTERGKLLFGDDLTQPPAKDWKASKGKWDIADGVLCGAEVKSEAHAAALRHNLTFRDAVIQVAFR